MAVRDLVDQDLPQVYALLVAHGWSHRLGTLSKFEALVAASQCNLVALHGDEVVGYARAITDGPRACLRSPRGRAAVLAGWNARRGAQWIARLSTSAATPQTTRKNHCPKG
ncbi:hypothetical protein C8C93_2822 [Acidovorax sp. 93]|nr:hypothetical protein C8C93_2822 [Acidovorax sp. 93]